MRGLHRKMAILTDFKSKSMVLGLKSLGKGQKGGWFIDFRKKWLFLAYVTAAFKNGVFSISRAPPGDFFKKMAKNGQKMTLFLPFLGQKVPGFQGFGPKSEGQNWPSYRPQRGRSSGSSDPRLLSPLSIPNKTAQIGLQNGLKWLKMSELVLFLVESG